MSESFSIRTWRIIELARSEARRLRHEYIGTEHILLGIVSESEGVAAEALRSLGITLDGVRSAVESTIGVGPPDASPDDRGVTPRAKHVLGFAQQEAARRRGHLIEPEHLLLGVTREVQGVAARVLHVLRTSPEAVQTRVSGLMGRGDAGGARDA